MTLNKIALMINGSKNSSKDAIISLLAEDYPLNAKKIHSRIKREHAVNISYQAVHKTLKELEQNKIIVLNGRNYSLNIEWIEGIEKFSDSFKEKFFGEELSKPKTFVLNSMSEVDKFLLELFNKLLKVDGKKILFMQWSHYWIPLFMDRKIYKKLKENLLSVESFGAVLGDTKVDKWCEKFWKNAGAKVKTGAKPFNHSDTIVYGDFVIEFFYPKTTREKIDAFFASVKKIDKVNWNKFYENLFEEKTKIAIHIQRNPIIAEIIKEQIKSYFKKTKNH